jgi:hypothetical protein
MDQLIRKVVYDEEDRWRDDLPKELMQWELVFHKGESSGVIYFVGFPEWPGPSREPSSPSVGFVLGELPDP